MMVHTFRNYGVCGLCPSFTIPKLENTMFRKLDLFPPSDEGRETRHRVWGETEFTSYVGHYFVCFTSPGRWMIMLMIMMIVEQSMK
jgi:hypothetical protein